MIGLLACCPAASVVSVLTWYQASSECFTDSVNCLLSQLHSRSDSQSLQSVAQKLLSLSFSSTYGTHTKRHLVSADLWYDQLL